MVNALRSASAASIIPLIQASGDSSIQYLTNIIVPNTDHQPLALGLALAKSVLNGSGAVRVHGGGFGGSMLVVVPSHEVSRVTDALQAVFGGRFGNDRSTRKSWGKIPHHPLKIRVHFPIYVIE